MCGEITIKQTAGMVYPGGRVSGEVGCRGDRVYPGGWGIGGGDFEGIQGVGTLGLETTTEVGTHPTALCVKKFYSQMVDCSIYQAFV